MAPSRRQIFLGTFIHSKSRAELDYLHDSAACVDEHGVIIKVERGCGVEAAKTLCESLGWSEADVDVVACKDGQFFFPGFIGALRDITHHDTRGSTRPGANQTSRHPHPRLAVSQRRPLRKDYPTRLAGPVHVPHRGQSIGPRKGPSRLHGLRPSYPPSWHHHGRILRHHRRSCH